MQPGRAGARCLELLRDQDADDARIQELCRARQTEQVRVAAEARHGVFIEQVLGVQLHAQAPLLVISRDGGICIVIEWYSTRLE